MLLSFAVIATGYGYPVHRVRAQEAKRPTGGTIEGTVRYSGDVPRLAVADDDGRRRPLLHVAPKSGGLQYAVVHLEVDARETSDKAGDSKLTAPPKHKPRLAASGVAEGSGEPPPAVIDQEEHTFVPHVLAIRAGRSVRFTNSDIINHNVRTVSLVPRNEFNVYTGAGGGYVHRFYADRRGRPIMLTCDIHAWMRGWIYVFDHPYFAVTDKRGAFRITAVPPGRYRLIVRQPDGHLSREQEIRVKDGKVTRREVRFEASELKVD